MNVDVAYPCVIIDLLPDVWVAYTINLSLGLLTINAIIDVVSDIGVEVLTAINANAPTTPP